MATSYETMELVASHHAELQRLCEELLETSGRVEADGGAAEQLRHRVRALGWRLRAHRAEETAALLAEAGEGRHRVATMLRERHRDEPEVEVLLAEAARGSAPLEVARAACEVARVCRERLDRLVREA